jgi:ABC-type branched-subunit amino acid transport system substrate-binding protein
MTTMLPRPPWRNQGHTRKAPMALRRKVIIAASAVVALSGCGYGVASLAGFLINQRDTCMNSGPTIVMHQGAAGECVGISDGSYPFAPGNGAVAAALTKIKAEDEWVRANHPGHYVSVAFLLPISATGGGVQPASTQAEQLEGAYTAQYRANQVLNSTPYIQLLVASSGTQAAEWRYTNQLIASDVHSQHLVAVAGIGVSLTATIAEVKQLAEDDRIPVFASSVTSNAFDNIPNMVRMVPDNAEDVSAVLQYIWPDARTAMLMEDQNPTDSYDTTMVSWFTNGFRGDGHVINAILTYNTRGEVNPKDAVAAENSNRINTLTSSICQNTANYVLFAGRGRDLGTLLDDLNNRNCLTKPITIVTGDDVTDMPITAGVRSALASRVTLLYAGEANPQEWERGSGSLYKQGRQGFSWFSTTFGQLFHGVPDGDGDAMTGYDAMWSAISAADQAGSSPSAADVDLAVNQLHVLGASGPISLTGTFQGSVDGSNPVDKVIPILQVTSDGAYAFKKLESPPFG